MPGKLKSRKLWVFIALVALFVGNYLFNLGMPPSDLSYLMILGVSYILGQGYVDAKQQPVKDFPVNDITQAMSDIVQVELNKFDFAKNVPIEKIIEALTPILKYELQVLIKAQDTSKTTVSDAAAGSAPAENAS
jgi:hypothetical protein